MKALVNEIRNHEKRTYSTSRIKQLKYRPKFLQNDSLGHVWSLECYRDASDSNFSAFDGVKFWDRPRRGSDDTSWQSAAFTVFGHRHIFGGRQNSTTVCLSPTLDHGLDIFYVLSHEIDLLIASKPVDGWNFVFLSWRSLQYSKPLKKFFLA